MLFRSLKSANNHTFRLKSAKTRKNTDKKRENVILGILKSENYYFFRTNG